MTIAIAISGGIDSLVAAHLVGQSGEDAFGLHFLTGYEHVPLPVIAEKIKRISEQIHIPVHIVDLSQPFRKKVVEYFTRTYLAGKTPNPCLVCNATIKFDDLLSEARRLGAERLATGHYARTAEDSSSRHRLYKGADAQKDQSYFLAFLTQSQLRRACFPLQDMTKAQVRELASRMELVPVSQKESQDICFIQDDYASFLLRETGFCPKPGPISDLNGRIIGEHSGLHRFTVGQRRGINCPAAEPYYVIRLEPETNRLIVGLKDQLGVRECRVTQINWITSMPESAMRIQARIRYRHAAVSGVLTPVNETVARLRFDRLQYAVTPGQGAVFYQDDAVIGGGWIESDPVFDPQGLS